jgi:hypothetical protein
VQNSATEAKELLAANLKAIHARVSELIGDISQVEWVLSGSLNKFNSTPDHFAKWAVNRCKEIHYLGVFMEKHYQLGADAIKVVKKLNQYDDHDVIDFFVYLCADPDRLEAVLHDEDGFPDEFYGRLRKAARRWAFDVYRADREQDHLHDRIKVSERASTGDGDPTTVDTLAKHSYAVWQRTDSPELDDDDDDDAQDTRPAPVLVPLAIQPSKSKKQANLRKFLFNLVRHEPVSLAQVRKAATDAGYGRAALQTALDQPEIKVSGKFVELSEAGKLVLDRAAEAGYGRKRRS